MTLTLIGVLIGGGGAIRLTHLLSGFLFGVKPLDPVSFIATPLVLSVVALFSVWMPAIRATRVEPMAALRIE
jgi:ABC-type antimicrobial peptide transport system permease subunit